MVMRVRPANETGIYLRRHRHDWRQVGDYTWPSGTVEPMWKCRICGDVLVNRAVTVSGDQS